MKQDFFEHFKKSKIMDKLSHAFLIETQNIDTFSEKLLFFLYEQNLLKTKSYFNNINLIIIETEEKEIKTEQIMYLQQRFMTKPSNDRFNIYLIKNAEKLNQNSANKLLKFLEEPTTNIIGFLLVNNSQILSTLKSRCQHFKISDQNSLNETETETEIKEIISLLDNLNISNELEFKSTLSKIDRATLIDLFQKLILKYNEIMIEKSLELNKIKNISSRVLILENTLRMLRSNVNIDLVLDKLCIEVND